MPKNILIIGGGFAGLNLAKGLANHKQFKVTLIDVHAAYPDFAAKKKTTITDMLPDGMHPGDLGHQLIAEFLLPAIREALR